MNSNQYKCLSLLQPWASLCVHTDSSGKALKQIETRSWNTKYRGELLIHASKRLISKSVSSIFINNLPTGAFFSFTKVFETTDFAPLGAIIGKVDLDSTCPSELFTTIRDAENGVIITKQELAFGDYSPNRFGWMLSNPILFKEPIPCKGQLSIWNLPTELVPLVNQQIEIA